MDIDIRPEHPDQQAAIATVVRRAFVHHVEVADMVAAIRRSDRYRPGLALTGCAGDEVVGFVMLSGTDLVDPDGGRREVLTLTPLAVDPDRQGQGIGKALVRAGLEAATRAGDALVVLEGSPRYYGRLGFEPAATHGITLPLPDWAPVEAAQVFLPHGGTPSPGRIEYPPAIADLPEPAQRPAPS